MIACKRILLAHLVSSYIVLCHAIFMMIIIGRGNNYNLSFMVINYKKQQLSYSEDQ